MTLLLGLTLKQVPLPGWASVRLGVGVGAGEVLLRLSTFNSVPNLHKARQEGNPL